MGLFTRVVNVSFGEAYWSLVLGLSILGFFYLLMVHDVHICYYISFYFIFFCVFKYAFINVLVIF